MRRRGFFGVLGAAVAAPIAKVLPTAPIGGSALEAQALTGIAFSGLAGNAPPILPAGGGNSWATNRIANILAVRSIFPDKHQELLRRRNSHVSSIDPSILVLKSVSLTSKIRMQREKQIAEAHEKELLWLRTDELEEELFQ